MHIHTLRSFKMLKKDYTNFVQMYVTGKKRRGRPQKVYIESIQTYLPVIYQTICLEKGPGPTKIVMKIPDVVRGSKIYWKYWKLRPPTTKINNLILHFDLQSAHSKYNILTLTLIDYDIYHLSQFQSYSRYSSQNIHQSLNVCFSKKIMGEERLYFRKCQLTHLNTFFETERRVSYCRTWPHVSTGHIIQLRLLLFYG